MKTPWFQGEVATIDSSLLLRTDELHPPAPALRPREPQMFATAAHLSQQLRWRHLRRRAMWGSPQQHGWGMSFTLQIFLNRHYMSYINVCIIYIYILYVCCAHIIPQLECTYVI
jgi:hypothetical protein